MMNTRRLIVERYFNEDLHDFCWFDMIIYACINVMEIYHLYAL